MRIRVIKLMNIGRFWRLKILRGFIEGERKEEFVKRLNPRLGRFIKWQ
jgi:hypothetical protein